METKSQYRRFAEYRIGTCPWCGCLKATLTKSNGIWYGRCPECEVVNKFSNPNLEVMVGVHP